MNLEILDRVIRDEMLRPVGEAAELAVGSPESLKRLSSTAVEVLELSSLYHLPIHAILCQAILIGYKAAHVEKETEQLEQLYEGKTSEPKNIG